MKLKGTFTYLGVDNFHSPKNNKNYDTASFLQGTDVQKVFLNDDSKKLLNDIAVGQVVSVGFGIKTGQSTFISLLSVVPVNLDKQKTA